MRLEKRETISSQATPSPARARRTRSAPLMSAVAFKASKLYVSDSRCSFTKEANLKYPAFSMQSYDIKNLKVPRKNSGQKSTVA
jgi:hypothetical protein